ncbi:MAG: 16S rRNA processing protein RimM [Myxococcales bacterium]|nr:16S rRNA processing protein RimM [Myxococcales bacterium]
MTRRIAFGVFGRPHGVRGEIRFHPYNADSPLIRAERRIEVGSEEPGDPNIRTFQLESVRTDHQGPVVRLGGIGDRDAAGSLNGMVWYEDRANFAPVADGEYYHYDLVGAVVMSPDGVELGRVAEVWTLPASDVLVVRGREELLVPMVEAFVSEVNVEGRIIRLREMPVAGVEGG